MTETDTRIIEVAGVKLEVDMRPARAIQTFKVGDRVKVLVKQYSEKWVSHPGMVVGFDPFRNLPTIVVAYIEGGYSPKIEFAHLNSETKDTEICHMAEGDELSASDFVEGIDRQIGVKRNEIAELENQRAYFIKWFGKTFEEAHR